MQNIMKYSKLIKRRQNNIAINNETKFTRLKICVIMFTTTILEKFLK